MATEGSLGKDVLRDVSRSFYLSLRLLPRGFREPAGIGYLLARLSDTIADAGALPVEKREALLEAFGLLVATLPTRRTVEEGAEFARDLAETTREAGLPPGERVLVERTMDVFAAASGLDSELLASVRKVVGIIVGGQGWDLTRFAGAGCVALESDAELEKYAYSVAGCVGEFWTEVAFAVIDHPARAPREQMLDWGRNYGKGLQLVNILRDVPEDLALGRCYLPGVDPGNRAELLAAAGRWRSRCRELLRDGLRYVEALNGLRLRVASGLPVLLGIQTLDLLDDADWHRWAAGVKVSRRDVKRTMVRAAAMSARFLPGSWERCLQSAQGRGQDDQ